MPPVPVLEAGTPDELKLCYVLGWLEEDISKRMMEVAGFEAILPGEWTYQETFARTLRYMRRTSKYFHLWVAHAFVPGGEDPGAPDYVEGPRLLVICCSIERAYRRRPNKAQFEWFKNVVGMEPRWYLIDESFYVIQESACGLWRAQACCPLVCNFLLLVRLSKADEHRSSKVTSVISWTSTLGNGSWIGNER